MDEITKLENADVDKVRVANARTRPNATGLYGSDALDATNVKKIFDQYPDLLRKKLDEVIDFAKALLGILGNGVGEGTVSGKVISNAEAINSLSTRIGDSNLAEDSRFTEDVLASAILKLSEDLKKTDKDATTESTEVRKLIQNGDEALRQKYDQLVKERGVTQVEYSAEDAVLSFKDAEGNVLDEIDLPLESLFKNAYYDGENGDLVLVLFNGEERRISNEEFVEQISELVGKTDDLSKSDVDLDGCYFDTSTSEVVVRTKGGSEKRIAIKQLANTTVLVGGVPVSEFDADSKLDAKASPYSNVSSLYVAKPDGSQSLIQLGEGWGQVPVRATNGNIPLPLNVVRNDNHAVPKKYVDNHVRNYVDDVFWERGVPTFRFVWWEGELSKGTVGGEDSIEIYFPVRFTYTDRTTPSAFKATVQTTLIDQGFDFYNGDSGDIPLPFINLGDRIYRICASFRRYYYETEDDGPYFYGAITLNCQRLNGSTWEDTTDIAVTKIELEVG